MPIDVRTVEGLAPDQSSLTAASKLTKPAKWFLRACDDEPRIVWGECQGSGANPYRVMGDAEDHGYKCTCPSRKFPCKHVLALFWMFAEKPDEFATGEPPDWVAEWMSRRRKRGTDDDEGRNSKGSGASGSGAGKSILRATVEATEKPARELDAAEIAKREKAATTRREKARQKLLDGVTELESWVGDQLRLGLSGFLNDPASHCRKIAARLVDASATAMAGRIDEFPARLLKLPPEQRPAATVIEMGKWVLLARRFRAQPEDREMFAELARAQTREEVLENPGTLKVSGRWEVVGERVVTQRDGLVRQSTWLWKLDPADARFALLLDFYPAATGQRASSFSPGDQFDGTLAFFPAAHPLRATLAERAPDAPGEAMPWPRPASADAFAEALRASPWALALPVVLPEGQIGRTPRGKFRWRCADGPEWPLEDAPNDALLGLELRQAVAIWDGLQAQLLAADTNLGHCYLS